MIAWAENARTRLAVLDTSDELLEELDKERQRLAAQVGELAVRLTAARAEAAARFSEAVSVELAGLAMPHARVEVAVLPRAGGRDDPRGTVAGAEGGVGPDGGDEIELRLIAHPGAPALPLQKGASGGELSRVMLAVEVCLADTHPVPTFVFDEVDAGVGGAAAVEIGRRLSALAGHAQVLVVTHLPQVAAFADRHVVVEKSSDGTVTSSGLTTLDDAGREQELSRMLAGMAGSDSALAHARELLEMARSGPPD